MFVMLMRMRAHDADNAVLLPPPQETKFYFSFPLGSLKAGSYLASTNPMLRECTWIATRMHRDCHENAPGLPREHTGIATGMHRDCHGNATGMPQSCNKVPPPATNVIPRSRGTLRYGGVFRFSVRPEPVEGRNQGPGLTLPRAATNLKVT